ncbi:MAG: NADH-quinone oxidoreductase subunit NuoK [Planctomycetales bacterium]
MDPSATLNNYLLLGAILFSLGMIGFLTRRNLIVMFLCAELMLQGVSLSLVAFSRYHNNWGGQVFTVFSLALAGGEAAIALALIVVLFKRNKTLDVSLWQDLRESDQPQIPNEFGSEQDAEEQTPQWPHLTVAGRLPGSKQSANGKKKMPASKAESEKVEVPHG